MKSLAVVILLINFSNTYALSCLTANEDEPMTLSLSTHNSDKIIEIIEDLSPDGYDDNDVCRVELYVDYNEQQLRISFTEHLMDHYLEDQSVGIYISVEGDAIDKISIEHILEYACSDDGCELEFVKNYINWFITADSPNLISQLAPFILGNDGDGKGE